jgi:hypothetical protein
MSNGDEPIPNISLQTVSPKTGHIQFHRTKLRQAILTYNVDDLRNMDKASNKLDYNVSLFSRNAVWRNFGSALHV